MRVGLLDGQPLLRFLLPLTLRPDESESSAQLEAAHLEQELALLEAGLGILDGNPDTLVPHDDLTRAIVALRDDALEIRVLDRMILDHHREALFRHVRRGTLRDGPAHEGAAPLQSEVVVQPACGMLLDDKETGLRPVGVVLQAQASERLGRLGGGALRPVGIEGRFLRGGHRRCS